MTTPQKTSTPTIHVINFLLIFVNFSYVTHDLKISLVNYSPEVVLLKLPILHERLFFSLMEILNAERESFAGIWR